MNTANIIPCAALCTATLGTSVLAHQGNVAAEAMLPFTGFAFGLYLLVAVALLVTGFVLRRLGQES